MLHLKVKFRQYASEEMPFVRVSTVREKVREKNIFSRSGNCQGILKFVREFWNLGRSQGKVREF